MGVRAGDRFVRGVLFAPISRSRTGARAAVSKGRVWFRPDRPFRGRFQPSAHLVPGVLELLSERTLRGGRPCTAVPGIHTDRERGVVLHDESADLIKSRTRFHPKNRSLSPEYVYTTCMDLPHRKSRTTLFLKRSPYIATLHSQADHFYTDRSIILMYTVSLLSRLRYRSLRWGVRRIARRLPATIPTGIKHESRHDFDTRRRLVRYRDVHW